MAPYSGWRPRCGWVELSALWLVGPGCLDDMQVEQTPGNGSALFPAFRRSRQELVCPVGQAHLSCPTLCPLSASGWPVCAPDACRGLMPGCLHATDHVYTSTTPKNTTDMSTYHNHTHTHTSNTMSTPNHTHTYHV